MNTNLATFHVRCAKILLLAIIMTISFENAVAQHPTVSPTLLSCKVFVKNGLFAPKEPPVLQGSEFTVPDLRMRFVKRASNEEMPSNIGIFYVWEWLKYPYYDYAKGYWDEGKDRVRCETTDSADIIIPRYTVSPQGWYSGKYANENKNLPHFTRVEISLDTPKCGHFRVHLEKNELRKFRNHILAVTLPCGGAPDYRFEKLDSEKEKNRARGKE